MPIICSIGDQAQTSLTLDKQPSNLAISAAKIELFKCSREQNYSIEDVYKKRKRKQDLIKLPTGPVVCELLESK